MHNNITRYIFLFSLISVSSVAQSQTAMELYRINSTVNLDGIIDEPFWGHIEPLPMVMHKPIYGNKPLERTELLCPNCCWTRLRLYPDAI